MGKVKRAGDLLSSLFNGQFDTKSMETGRVSANLFTTWAAITAETKISAAADHSRIRDLEHGILVIEAEHPGWVQLLQTKQAQLLHLVQKRYPELEIRGLSFCLSRESISRPSVEHTSSAVTESAATTVAVSGNEAIPPEPGITVASDPEQDPPERDEALYESMVKFRKTIQKRNRNITR
jgi:hypothetical protein